MRRSSAVKSMTSGIRMTREAWNDPELGIDWPELKREYKGCASAEGYRLEGSTALNLSEKDQKWLGLKETFKF